MTPPGSHALKKPPAAVPWNPAGALGCCCGTAVHSSRPALGPGQKRPPQGLSWPNCFFKASNFDSIRPVQTVTRIQRKSSRPTVRSTPASAAAEQPHKQTSGKVEPRQGNAQAGQKEKHPFFHRPDLPLVKNGPCRSAAGARVFLLWCARQGFRVA